MNKIKKYIKFIINPISIRIKILGLILKEYLYLVKYLNLVSDTQEKQRASILIQSHIIEKGLSLKDVRPNFGVPKILNLLDLVEKYYYQYHDQEILLFVLSIVNNYIKFNESVGCQSNDQILKLYSKLKCNIDDEQNLMNFRGGVINVNKLDIDGSKFNYLDFIKTRHSIRNFTGAPIDKKIIEKALKMAEYTPSACNRQPWNIYVVQDRKKIIEVLDKQTGARQFKNDVGALVIVGSSAMSFSLTEYHQMYLNAGLYSMNIINAFHSLGVGTIPLNLGIDFSNIQDIRESVQISNSVIPILLIAIGEISDMLNVACSYRFPYTEYTKFI